MRKKFYLGDSVYVSFDGWGFMLTTENGLPTDPSNRIYLEPKVLESLSLYVEELYQSIREVRDATGKAQGEDQVAGRHAGDSTGE